MHVHTHTQIHHSLTLTQLAAVDKLNGTPQKFNISLENPPFSRLIHLIEGIAPLMKWKKRYLNRDRERDSKILQLNGAIRFRFNNKNVCYACLLHGGNVRQFSYVLWNWKRFKHIIIRIHVLECNPHIHFALKCHPMTTCKNQSQSISLYCIESENEWKNFQLFCAIFSVSLAISHGFAAPSLFIIFLLFSSTLWSCYVVKALNSARVYICLLCRVLCIRNGCAGL